jgi:hypothetical protein
VATPNPGQLSGVRWYEIRDPNGTPTVFQQGTYAPIDPISRWMGSIAMDKNGNIGVGYSASSSSLFPSIRATGHLTFDPTGALQPDRPGVMGQGELTLLTGGGSQTRNTRWGDYTSMTVDPVDDCTFWYVNEYYTATAGFSWASNISSFKFPSCN